MGVELTNSEPLKLALGAIDTRDSKDDKYSEYVRDLKRQGDVSLFATCKRLAASIRPQERELAVDVLCEFGTPDTPFLDERRVILAKVASSETNQDVIEALGYAFSHLHCQDAVPFLVKHSRDNSSEIRYAMACGLGQYDDDSSIKALLNLSNDKCDRVRNIAIFGIAALSSRNDEEIIELLRNTLSSNDEEIEYEALNGLCRRGDEVGIAALEDIISCNEPDVWFLDIATEAGDGRLLSTLESIDESLIKDPETLRALQAAIKSCGETGATP